MPAADASVTPSASDKRRARRLYQKLETLYPDARCALHYTTPWELLAATILSAQCTDARVNLTTPALFKKYPGPQAMAKANPEEIEPLIKSCGFFRNKAKSLHGAATAVVERFDGEVPREMDDLLTLPGVARKTANVVLGNAFDRNQGIPVDTHVTRLSQRLGLSEHTDPVKIERDLMALYPRTKWCMLSHLLIFHGRQTCRARNPACDQCKLGRDCCRVCDDA